MSDSKTEQATPRRRQDARKEGQVARSEDMTYIVLFGLFFSYLIVDGARICQELMALILLPYQYLDQPFPAAAGTLAGLLLTKALTLILIFLIMSVALSFIVQLLQIGPLFSAKSITPSLKKLNMVQNIKEMFSVSALVDLLKIVAKTSLMGIIVYLVLKGNLRLLLLLPPYGIPGIYYATGRLMQQLTLTIFFVFSVLAVIDVLWQRHLLNKKLMMQKHEVKREQKDNEGDPHTKNSRRNLFREIVSGDVDLIPRASVVVANPTHLAIVLYYQPQKTGLPIILAKGSGIGAQQIFRAARHAGVPIVQNVGVARTLFPLAIYSPIPSELIDAVAEIIVVARKIRRAANENEEYSDSSEIQDGVTAQADFTTPADGLKNPPHQSSPEPRDPWSPSNHS